MTEVEGLQHPDDLEGARRSQGWLRVVQQVEEGHLSSSAAESQAFPLELTELFTSLVYVVPRSVLRGNAESLSMEDEGLHEPEPPVAGDVASPASHSYLKPLTLTHFRPLNKPCVYTRA